MEKKIYVGDVVRKRKKNPEHSVWKDQKSGHQYKKVKRIINKNFNGFNISANKTWEIVSREQEAQ